MGMSSIGKTQLLIQFLLGCAIQLRAFNLPGVVVVNTYEMLGKQYAKRMASCISGVNLQAKELLDEHSGEYRRLMEAFDFVDSLPILYDDGDMTSTQIISQTLALAVEVGGIHVFGIDYSELVPDKNTSEEQRVAQVFRNAQSLSRKLDAAGIVLSQVSDFGQDTRIAGAWGTRYSKAGWHASECELEIVNYPQMKLQGINFRVPDYLGSADKAYALVHKNKNGPVGHFALEWTPGCTRFTDPALAGFGMAKLFENFEQVWDMRQRGDDF